jgi:hypothetical protein
MAARNPCPNSRGNRGPVNLVTIGGMSEEDTLGRETAPPPGQDEETVDNTVDPQVQEAVEQGPLPPIEAPRRRHPLLVGVIVVVVVAIMVFMGWLMLFRRL